MGAFADGRHGVRLVRNHEIRFIGSGASGHARRVRRGTTGRRPAPQLSRHLRPGGPRGEHDDHLRSSIVPPDRRERRGLRVQRRLGRELCRRRPSVAAGVVHLRGDRPGAWQPWRLTGGADATPRLRLPRAGRHSRSPKPRRRRSRCWRWDASLMKRWRSIRRPGSSSRPRTPGPVKAAASIGSCRTTRATPTPAARCRSSASRTRPTRPEICATGSRRATTFEAAWITITEPNPSGSNVNAVFEEGYANGAALFNRLEGIFYADRSIFFVSTSGGDVKNGDINTPLTSPAAHTRRAMARSGSTTSTKVDWNCCTSRRAAASSTPRTTSPSARAAGSCCARTMRPPPTTPSQARIRTSTSARTTAGAVTGSSV